jgi:hypothetical protein
MFIAINSFSAVKHSAKNDSYSRLSMPDFVSG